MTKQIKMSLAMNDKGSQMNNLGITRKGEWNVLPQLLAVIVCGLLLFGLVGQVVAAGDIDSNGTYIEAENYNQLIAIGSPSLGLTADGSANGGSVMETTSGGTTSPPPGDRLEYEVNFTTAGTYYFWIRLLNSGTGDSAFVGIDGTMVGALTQSVDGAYYWTNTVQTGANNTSISAGPHTLNIWGRENVFIDGIYITTISGTPPSFGGSAGAYTGTIPTGATVLDPTNTGGGDTTAPTVTAFTLPATSSSPISVTSFTANDDTAVTGYMITESATAPAAGDAGWTGTAPSSITTASTGSTTFYAWAKDAAGNVSTSLNATVDVTTGGTGGGTPDVDPTGAYIEAEDYVTMGAANPWAWDVQSSVSGFEGTGYLYTTNGGTGTQPNGSRVDFPVNFTGAGTYQIWLRARDQDGSSGGDSTFWGIDGTVVGALTQATDNVWSWTTRLQSGSNTASVTAGNHIINLWPREAGQHTDSIFIIRTGETMPGNISEGSTSGVPTGFTALDFSGSTPGGGGGGSGYIFLPDGQVVNGGPLTFVDTTAGGPHGSQDIEYQTDLSGLQYRALGGQADGFPGYVLDTKWTKTDIGGDSTPAPTVNDGTLTLQGAGANIWSSLDYFSYLYQNPVDGDFTIDVNISSLTAPNTYTKVGIMVRQNLTANSANVAALVTGGAGARIQYRATNGGTTVNATGSNSTSAPEWIRLVRSGTVFNAYTSADGLVWTAVSGTANVSFIDPVYIGLAVTSNSTGNAATAEFTNFHYMPAATSGMSTTWASVSGNIDNTGWPTGTYGVVLNSGSVFETMTFDYEDCMDLTPSTITVPAGETVSGPAVSLSALFTHTGNVDNFIYQINGAQVNNPWNSYSEVPSGTSGTVTLTVYGEDPDCNGTQVVGSGVITVDNNCVDPTPSTLTILTGQVTGGATVDLTTMFSQTGNVGTLTYKINGTDIPTPNSWDSSAYGQAGPESVTLEITGTDPDCGSVVTALNSIVINNICVRNPPSISFDQDISYVGPGRAIPYKLTIRNEDNESCSASTFDVNIIADPVNSDFEASFFNPLGSNSNITLGGHQSTTFELAVQATATATEWAQKDTTVEITSSYTGDGDIHNSPKTTGSVTTKVFLVSPITHSSVTTDSTKWGGTWGTSEPGSKYGNFDCMLCHIKDSNNVMWLRQEIKLPGADWGTGTTAEDLPVDFQDVRENGDWGHDDPNGDGSGRTSSNKVCEVCHTITQHHRYDTNADPVDPPEGPVGPQTIVVGQTHFPNRECIDCHRHSLGFTASCTGCHGDPPLEATLGGPNGLADVPGATGSVTPGTHYKHTVVLGFPCEYCHAGWRNIGEMPRVEPNSGKQQINHTFDVFGSPEPEAMAGEYTGQDGVNYQPRADLFARGIQDANGTVLPGKGTMTCENIYCHGGTENMGGTNPQWNGNIHCNSCHGTSATDTPPGYSHTTHVGKMGLACTVCHGLTTGLGANGHVSGSVHVDLSELQANYNSPAAVYNGVGGTANGAKWDSDRLAPSDPDVTDGDDQYGTCSNIACHFGNDTPVWNNHNQPATCTLCHNDGNDTGLLANAAPVTGAHAKHRSGTVMGAAFIDQCQSCHGGGANTGNHTGHANFVTNFGTNLNWNATDRNCTNTCHEANYAVGLWDSLEDLDCSACHKAPYLGPTVVDPTGSGTGMAASGYGSHLKTSKTETIDGNTNWKSQCMTCHPYHTGGTAVPLPPANWTAATGTNSPLMGTDMQDKLGLRFPITNGIHLGGTATSGASEAEICWNCHGADDEINEWGYNYDSNGAFPYTKLTDLNGVTAESHNYGWVYQDSSWTTMTSAWVDASGNGSYRKDGYQHSTETTPSYANSRRISSVHSVNFTLGSNHGSSVEMNIDASGNVIRTDSQTLETPDEIRCTYCHDVHDQNRALLADGVTYETATGRPYLRGTWFGNPYAADMPPLNSYTYPITGGPGVGQRFRQGTSTSVEFFDTNGVPRLFSSLDIQSKGGYFLDQNGNMPTSGKAEDLTDTAGLCVLCHGNDVSNMDYYNTNSMWRDASGNGHANSTLGGGGAGHANARNIFDGYRGTTTSTGMFIAGQDGVNRSRYGDQTGVRQNGPYRSEFYRVAQSTASNSPPRNTGWYGGTPGDTARGGQYNTWYSGNTSLTDTASIGTNGTSTRAHDFSCSKCHSPHATGLPALLATNCLDFQVSNFARTADNSVVVGPTTSNAFASRAQNNCHRNESTSTGWHRLAPAQ